jgi:hypothetical protein
MKFVCAHCGVYCREERTDGYNHFTVCAYCGRPELRFEEGSPSSRPLLRLTGPRHRVKTC